MDKQNKYLKKLNECGKRVNEWIKKYASSEKNKQ